MLFLFSERGGGSLRVHFIYIKKIKLVLLWYYMYIVCSVRVNGKNINPADASMGKVIPRTGESEYYFYNFYSVLVK